MVTLTYTLSEPEFMRAVRVLWSYQGIGDTGNLILALLSGIVGVALLAFEFWTGWIWLGAMILFVAITWGRNTLWRRAYPRMLKYTASITAEFTKTEVATHSAEGVSKLPWSTFRNYAETPEYFFLFLDRRRFSILPKSAIVSDVELEDLRDLIAANLPRAKMRWT